jgi:hypothetical protein
MAQYCTLKEAWGSPVTDWNNNDGEDAVYTPKPRKSKRKKHLRRSPPPAILMPYDDASDNEGAPYAPSPHARRNKEQLPSPHSRRSKEQLLPPPVVHEEENVVVEKEEEEEEEGEEEEDVEADDDADADANASEEDDKMEKTTTTRGDNKNDVLKNSDELDWLKNQVSYLLTKMDQLSTQLSTQKTSSSVSTSMSTVDVLLFVVIGIFGIIVLDIFFRFGSSTCRPNL